jgi:hypothetical protein
MRHAIPWTVLSLILAASAPGTTEAPAGFDNKTNGVVDDATHLTDQTTFEEVEQLKDGLGPLSTRNLAASVTRARFRAPPRRSRNCASATMRPTATSAIPTFPSLTAQK